MRSPSHFVIKALFKPTYVEMNCIGDYADFVVSGGNRPDASTCTWMVPGSELGRDEFGRKVEA